MRVSAELLKELASLAQTDRTVLSAYLDVSKGWDGVKPFLEKERKKLIPVLTSDEKDYFETSLSFLEDYIAEKKSQGFRGPGIAFFADLGANYTRGIEMTVVPKQFIAVDDEAVIHPLALELDEYEAIGVIMIDASCTRILITAGQIIEDVDSLCTKIHHLSKVGGWSQMRYQRRRQKQIHHFTKDVLEKATAVFSESGVRRIIIAGRDRMITALEQELPKAWAEKVIAKVRWDLNEPGREFVKKIKPMLEQAERDQEKVLVDQLVRELRRGELGVAGFDATMKALSMAQVDILFVSKGIDARTCEKLVSLAQSTGAYVEFVPVDNKTLAALGNVGGLLRYKI